MHLKCDFYFMVFMFENPIYCGFFQKQRSVDIKSERATEDPSEEVWVYRDKQ